MKTITSVFQHICCTVIFALPGISLAQGMSMAQLQTELISAWLVTIEGDEILRKLRISAATPGSENKLILEAAYGPIDGKEKPIEAVVIQTGQTTTLQVITPAGSHITAVQTAAGTFDGTVTNKKGNVKEINIQRVTDAQLQTSIRNGSPNPAVSVVKPAPEVPEACALYSGIWQGTWARANLPPQQLRVFSIDRNCIATFSYGDADRRLGSRRRMEQIREGTLSFSCNATQGTCSFERHGNSLWASYSDNQGGRNSAAFERVQ